MDVIKSTFCLVLVLNIVAVISIEEKKETNEEFISRLFDPESGLLDEDTAEILWMLCTEDLIHVRKDIGDFGLCLPKESLSSNNEISTEIGSISRENIQKIISTCNPQLKENFLNCLRQNNVLFQDDSKNWKDGYEGSGLSRRYLRRVSPRHLGEKTDNDNGDSDSDSDSDSGKKSKKKSDAEHEQAIIHAMIITAVVTFIFAACVFLCICMYCGGGIDRQTDERPLLSMSMNDYSVGT